MADILLFPAERTSTAAHRSDASRPPAVAPPDAETWSEDDAGDNGDLEMVASLAAAPCQSLVGLVDKMQVLVTRLAPDDDPDAGLCLAEASLLRSVLHDLRVFVMDTAFAAQGAGLLLSRR
ncbi:hypothetical protein E2C06_34680 [Dankookia rubra]|uniref:Uncharacterized protein n=1 Tax=Dankookia rubra TaxID=1442381 RepID=A0A4V3A956_9PROT|nr:hypothetical protein [Dankookia rubra]TDH58035.1 hypothetical protein E2C06_34680 [Dankookia rubra]